jgi:hypothetical protein
VPEFWRVFGKNDFIKIKRHSTTSNIEKISMQEAAPSSEVLTISQVVKKPIACAAPED